MKKVYIFLCGLILSLAMNPDLSSAGPSWVSLAGTNKEDIQKLVSTGDGTIYSLTGKGRVLRLEKDEKSWIPLEKGFEVFQQPKVISLTSHQGRLYALAVSNDGKQGDVFQWGEGSWQRLHLPIKNPAFVEGHNALLVNDHGIVIQKAIDSGDPSILLEKTGGAWKETTLPHSQFEKMIIGKIHPFYGLSGQIFVIGAGGKGVLLGTQWPNTAAVDVLEVGKDIYSSNTFTNGGLLLLKFGQGAWKRTSFPENCHFPSSLYSSGNQIYLKGSCGTADQKKDKIFSYSTPNDSWHAIESPFPNAQSLGPLLVSGGFLYLATENGGFYKLKTSDRGS